MKKVVFVALPALAFCLVLSVCPVYAAGQQSTGFDQNRPTAPAARTTAATTATCRRPRASTLPPSRSLTAGASTETAVWRLPRD